MKAEFWCSRWIGVEVVEKDERLDPFTNVARTNQSGNEPVRVSTRSQSNLPGSFFSAYRTHEHCIGLHFRSPEVWISKLQSSALDPVKQGNEFITPKVDNHRVEHSQDDRWDRTGVQDEQMGCHGTDHGETEPQGTDRSQAGNEQSNGADHFHDPGHDAEPLAESDLVEQVDHEGNASQFGEAGGKESGREDTLQRPGADATRRTD
jgi:hypothetical protein